MPSHAVAKSVIHRGPIAAVGSANGVNARGRLMPRLYDLPIAEPTQHEGGRQSRLRGPATHVFLRLGQPGTVEALLLVVDGQHTESDRLAGRERHLREAVGRGRRDV